MRPLLIAAAALLVAGGAAAQVPDTHLSRAQAARDVSTLVALLESSHPDPYTALGGKVEFRRRAQGLAAEIPDSGESRAHLADRLSIFLARLHDGHTFLSGASERWRDPEPRLPVLFGVAADGIYVSAYGTDALKGTLGWKVIAVNGVPLQELLARFDGYPTENIYGGYAVAVNLLRGFRYMSNLLGPQNADGAITYTLERPNGRREERALPWSARTATPPARWVQPPVSWSAGPVPAERAKDLFVSRVLDHPAAGYLRVGSLMGREAFELSLRMNPQNAQLEMERFYRMRGLQPPADVRAAIPTMPSLFDTTAELLRGMQRRGVSTLIVDLRGNDGGWTPSAYPMLHAIYGDAFYATPWPGDYVTVESPLYLQKKGETVEQRRARDASFEPGSYLFSRDSALPDAEKVRLERLSGYKAAGYSFAAPLEALGGNPVYRPGRVVVLVDQGTYSAAFHTLMWLRRLGAAVVGVPPRQSPNAFMEVTPFTLPESGLQGSISNSVQYMLPEQPSATVLEPDFPVTLQVVRRYSGDTDAALRYALELLAKGRMPERAGQAAR